MKVCLLNKKFIFPLLIVLVAGAVLYQKYLNRSHSSDDSIRVSGNIEVTDAELSFKIAGRVTERLVTEGDKIEKGQIIARLDDSDLIHDVAARKADLKKAEAALQEMLAGSRPQEIEQAYATAQKTNALLNQLLAGSRPQEIAVAQAEVENARSDLENMTLEYHRQDNLLKDGVTSQDQYDKAKAAYLMATARLKEAEEKLKLSVEGPRKEEIEQARHGLKESTEHYSLVKEGFRKEEIAQAQALLELAKANLRLSETRLSYATITAPLSGVVLSKNIEPGEYVAPGTPIVTAADLQDIWLRAYIRETDLGRVKLGQLARVQTDTYPGKVYEGKVTFIASQAEFTPKNVQTEKERVKLVYRVKITLSNANLELKPGMPADAEILTEKEQG